MIELANGEDSRGHASSATGVGVTTRTWRKWHTNRAQVSLLLSRRRVNIWIVFWTRRLLALDLPPLVRSIVAATATATNPSAPHPVPVSRLRPPKCLVRAKGSPLVLQNYPQPTL